MNGHASINKAFRLVWSDVRGSYLVAPETACGQGKASRSAGTAKTLAAAMLLPFALLPAVSFSQTTVQVAGGTTTAYVAPNGVPVVNIANPNGAGLSHNQFHRYDVEAKGLVLNNSSANVQSQLAGLIAGNANLSASAQVILNEVVANNRSVLAGFTEVAGAKAAVVVANPYGITCNGCGFINTDRVTLTTGTPVLDNGRLASFSVVGGDVLIGGNGLNASAQEMLDIVTRGVRIEGTVNTAASGTLGITTGANQWDYDSRAVTGSTTPGGAAPSYAIDSTTLGGMYAGQIRLIATESGVGVRMLGEAAARASDFTLTAAGKVEINAAKLSAERDIQLASSSNAADALALTDASLSAKRDLSLQATTGGATLSGGVLVASANLTGNLGSFSDAASAATQADNNARQGSVVSLAVTGAASVAGTNWGADNAFALSAASLTANNAALFYAGSTLGLTATSGNLALGDAKARATGNLSLSANSGQLTFAAGGGAQTTTGNLGVIAGGGFGNAGILTADAGSLSLQADGASSNSGTLNAHTTLSLARKTNSDTGAFTNTASGKLLSGGNQTISLHALDNSGAVESAGTLGITAESLINSGTLLTHGSNQGAVTLAGGTLANSGTIGSAGALSLTSSATSGTGDSVTNSGTLQSAGGMALSVGRQMTNAYAGKIISGGALTLTSAATEFNNTTNGVLQSAGAMTLGESGHLLNLTMEMATTGQTEGHRIISDDTLTLAAKSVSVPMMAPWTTPAQLRIQARKGMAIDTETWTGANTVALVASTEDEGSFVNRLRATQSAPSNMHVSSYGDFELDVAGLDSWISSIKSTHGSVTVNAKRFSVESIDAAVDIVANIGQGTYSWDRSLLRSIIAGRDIRIGIVEDGYLLLRNVRAGRDLTVTTPGDFFRIDYENLVEAGRHLGLGADGKFVRIQAAPGYLRSLDTMSIVSDSALVTSGTLGNIEAKNQLILQAATLGSQHAGSNILFSTNPDTPLTSSARFTGNLNSIFGLKGRLHSAGNLDIVFDQDIAVGASLITTSTTAVLSTGSITSAKQLNITAANIYNSGGILYGGTGLTLSATGAVRNSYGYVGPASGAAVYLSPESLAANTPEYPSWGGGLLYFSPELISSGSLNITANTFFNESQTIAPFTPSEIVATGDISITTGGFTNAPYSRLISNNGSISLTYTGATNTFYGNNSGLISAANTLSLNSATAFVNKTIGSYPAAVLRATSITGSGDGGLTNSGSPASAAVSAKSASAGTPPAGPTTVSATTPLSAVTPQAITAGGTLSFGGFSVTLPSKPNGYFVISKDPTSRFLVETNPLYLSGASLGSDYLMTRYGINPEKTSRRLGDDNYEAYLIRQQLIEATGSNVLRGYGNENDQVKRLMDQAFTQGAQGGFVFGQALTPTQIAGLTQDIVWMETINVGGQPVLVPRVYLAQSTRDMITGGATIMAETIDLEGGLTNQGGTITSSGKDLTITAGGDITNQGGNMGASGDVKITSTGGDITNRGGTLRSGGNMDLTASQGDITNETLTRSDRRGNTSQDGATARIEAGGNLTMGAAQDITVRGADVSAGGNANLKAGENVTFDTIVETSTTRTREGGAKVTTTTATNIGSNLNVGGNLNLESGKDTTLAGSKASVGGDLTATTGGDFNVVARQDTVEVKTSSSSMGFGVGGGVFGATSTQTNEFTGTNVGSTLNVGGNADVNSTGRTLIQGSDVTVGGDGNIQAGKGIDVLDGLDEKRSTTRTSTTTLFSSASDSGSGSQRQAQSGSGLGVAGASAGGSAQATANADLNLMKSTTTTTTTTDKTSVGSNLNVGGNLTLGAQGDVTVQGSNVAAGGNLNVTAENVNILTGRNESSTETTSSSFALGVFAESGANAEGSAGAQATARGPLDTGAGANAGGNAGADATATFGVKTTESRETSNTVTNTSSTLSSGGNMNIGARDTATFQGAKASSGGDMNIEGNNIRNLAAQDTTQTTSSSSTNMGGLYVGASAGASASAEVSASAHQGADGDAGGQAGVEGAAGVRFRNTQENSVSGSTTQVTNTFTAGGNLNRNAKDTIVDQGTQAEAGGNITQSARVIRDEAVSDSTFSSGNSQSHEARIAITAGAEAKAGNGEAPDAGTSVAGKATYEGEISSASERETTAVTSRFKAGGDINSTSTEQTTLVGTQFEAGRDVNLKAGSLEYKAAADTSSSKETTHSISAEISVSKEEVGAKGAYGLSAANNESSTARTGGISAGGNVNISTRGDASLEGTNLSSGGDTNLRTGGNLEIKAARDTSSDSATNFSVQGETTGSRSNGDNSAKGEAQGSIETSRSDQARVGSITSGGNLNISSGGNTTLEGTQASAGGTAQVQAGGKVTLQEATSTSSSAGVSGGVVSKSEQKQGDGGTQETTRDTQGQYSAGAASGSSRTGTNIQGGGGVSIQSNVPGSAGR